MNLSKSLLTLTVALSMTACGTASKNQKSESQDPTPASAKDAVAKMDSTAPKYIVAIADKNGNLIKSSAVSTLPQGQTVAQIAAGILADNSTTSSVQVLTGDEANNLDSSTQSCHFWHNNAHYWGAPVMPIYSSPAVIVVPQAVSVAPVYAYQNAGFNYYANYGVYGGAAVPYNGANYNATVYNYANSYGYAAQTGAYGNNSGIAGGYEDYRNLNQW